MTAFTERLTASSFYVELKLDGSQENVDATFLECRGIERSQEIIEICEVTPQQWGKAKSGQLVRTKIPGNVKTSNITLSRGMTNSMTLWNWFKAVEEGNWAKQFREGSLTIYDRAGVAQVILEFQGAWPTRYKASGLNAGSGEMEIEELELAIGTLTRSK